MPKTIGILTGGGDCPGLNSVIYGVLLKAADKNFKVIGIEKGWKGFLENRTIDLDLTKLDNLHTIGGTLIYTSRTNPYKQAKKIKDSLKRKNAIKETAQKMATQMDKIGIDILITIGGDDTLGAASTMYEYAGAKVLGVPKTIDNDLSSTDYTFGFWSAVQLASNSMDNIVTTARSHQRIFVIQVMGRDAGWLTLASGISAGADIILVPEKPFDFQKDIISVLEERVKVGKNYHIIACSEGAIPTKESLEKDFTVIDPDDLNNLPKDDFGNPILAKLNMSKIIVKELNKQDRLRELFKKHDVEYDIRDVILGHTMRAGTPNAFDRVLGVRLGVQAVKLAEKNDFGKMVCLDGTSINSVPLIEGSKKKIISLDSDLLEIAELISRQKSGKLG
jgi:6-phosphofructokinase 1